MNIFPNRQMKSLLLILATTCGTALSIFGTVNFAVASELTANKNSAVNSRNIARVSTCPKYTGGGKLFAKIETRNFIIHLCDRRGTLFYTGISKQNGRGIYSLPTYSEEGIGIIAKNGQYEYVVTGAELSISKNGKLLQSERVIKYVSGNSN